MKCVLLGATRGVGLEILLNLIKNGHVCYVLARNVAGFDETLAQRGVTDKGLINVVKGDAFQEKDIESLFHTAGNDVEFVLFSLGGRPTFKNPLFPKLEPPQICTRTVTTFLPVFTRLYPTVATQPRLVVISSNGLGAQGHKDLPFTLKPLYGWLLKEPHQDKEEMERQINSYAGIQHVDFNPDPSADGNVKLGNLVIVRPSLLMDGVAKKDYRVGERLESAWCVSRADVGWFVVEGCLPGNDTWKNKGVTVSY